MDPALAGGSRRLLRLYVGLTLAAGALLPLARVALEPANVLPGTGRGEMYKRAWAFWHTPAQILNGDWVTTSFLNAPRGGTFLDIMALPALIMGPITAAGGPVLSANLWVFFSLVAVGWTTYALCKHLGASIPGALCGGVLMQTAPYLMGLVLASGVHERLPIWIFPLTLLVLLKLRDGAGWRWPLLLLPTSLLAISQSPTYGLFLALLLVATLPLVLHDFPRQEKMARLIKILAACLGLALVVGTIALLYRWLVAQPDFLAGIQTTRLDFTMDVSAVEMPAGNQVTLDKLLNPLAVRATLPMVMDDELYKLVYIGWIPLLAFIAGALVAWRRGQSLVVGLAGLSVLFIILSLGPSISALGTTVPNVVFHLASFLVPYFGRLPSGWQLNVVALILAMPAVGWLLSALGAGKPRIIAAVALLSLGLAERAVVLPVPLVQWAAPARVPSIYAAAQGEGALVDIPRLIPGQYLTHGAIFLAQTAHHHPIPMSVNLGRGENDYYRPVAWGEADDWTHAMGCLKLSGLRWVMVHEDWFVGADASRECLDGVIKAVGPPVSRQGPMALFDLAKTPCLPVPAADSCPLGRSDMFYSGWDMIHPPSFR